MDRLVKVEKIADINPAYVQTPIGDLLEYHNLHKPFDIYQKAKILIGMCMDNRNHLNIPANFAYIIRSGGANLRYSEFKVSYSVAIGGVKAIALIAHNDCGMVNLFSKKQDFIQGLVDNGGWDEEWAEEHFAQFSPMFEIGNAIDFVLCETHRLRKRYPKILVAPLYYKTENNLLYQVNEI